MTDPAYTVRRAGRSRFLPIRGLRTHLLCWGEPTPAQPLLVMLHGWMDVAASFQFVVDALHAAEGEARAIVAIDWRGFGETDRSGADSYWFPDYLGDLDAVLDVLSPDRPVDLLGHSMGGNIAMVYAGVRPSRVRKLINLEGFGVADADAAEAPGRYAKWLDQLKRPMTIYPYASVEAVAMRLRKTNPLLSEERAAWIAPHWSRRTGASRFEILGDPVHKRVNPVLYRQDEISACWRAITAPLLWVEGDQTRMHLRWNERYTRKDFYARLGQIAGVRRHVLSPAGHMLHHDQPEALAGLLTGFLGTG